MSIWILYLPNALTISRILMLAPALYFLESKLPLASLISLAGLFATDFFDGWFARKLNASSVFGAILDPVADKIVTIVLFGFFFWKSQIPSSYFALVLFRDIAQISAVPILLFFKKIQFQVKPKLIPKIGTALKFFLLGMLASFYLWDSLWNPELFSNTKLLFILLSSLCELQILWHFIPRFFEIYRKEHDTFE